MAPWIDAPIDPAGFGSDHAWTIRDLPELGVVMSVAQQGLSTWDRRTRVRLRRRLPTAERFPGRRSQSVAIDSVGSLLWLEDGTIWELAADALQPRARMTELPSAHDWLCISDDDRLGVCSERDLSDVLIVLDMANDKELWRLEREHNQAELCPRGRHLLVAHEQSWQAGSDTVSFALFDVLNAAVVLEGSATCWNESLSFSADGRQLLLVEHGHQPCRRWKVPGRHPRKPPPCPTVGLWSTILASLEAHPTSRSAPGILAWRHPLILELERLRDAANALASERNGLEFADERSWLDDAEMERLAEIEPLVDGAIDRLREHLRVLHRELPQLLQAYHDARVEQLEARAKRYPEETETTRALARWRSLAAGEIHDLIFGRLLDD